MKHFRPYSLDQLLLLPPSLREWVPDDHEIHFLSDAVDQMDLGAIYASYDDPRGNPAYHPRMMVKVLCYAFARGVRSSRKIERMLWEDVPMRVLSGNQQPDFWTIAEFRKRHRQALGELLVQTVRMARAAGLTKLGHVAVDGTKIKANASKHSAMSYGYMEREEARLKEEVGRYQRESAQTDETEDRQYGNRRGDELPAELATREKRLAAIERAKAILEEQAQAKAAEPQQTEAASGARRQKRWRKTGPKDKAQYNFTDPESRIMRTSSGAFEQCYNAQAAVDADSQIIVAAELTNQAADAPHLVAVVDQVEANAGRRPHQVSADAGYFSDSNVHALMDRGIEALIPPEKVTHQQWREMTSPRGRPPKDLDLRGWMRRKLRTKEARARYKLRQETVEPVFGQIKWNRGLHQFLLRGLAAARASWRFECAVHNLLKMRTAGVVWG